MSQVSISNLSFKYDAGGENIFDDVSVQFDTDWKLGLVGRNGYGKTTLMKLLMGEREFYGSIASSVPFSYFPFPVGEPELTVSDVLGGLGLDCAEWELRRELKLLFLPDDILSRLFVTLSGGERTKALIAALFLRKNHFLLLDEPTNHLDGQGHRALAAYLRQKKSFIIVSHDRAFLDGTVDHILSINRTGIEIQQGNFSQWLAEKERRELSEAARNKKLKSEISRLKMAARRTSEWSDKIEATKIGAADKGYVGHKSAKMMKRSKSLEARRDATIEEKAGLLRNIERSGDLKIWPLAWRSEALAELSGVSIQYAGRPVISGVSFAVRRGGRVALMGRNGCGKSSLLKLVAGDEIPHSGIVSVGSGVKISRVPQETSGMIGSLPAFASDVDRALFFAILDNLGFEKKQFENDMSELSDGQRKKALIAKSLSESAHLYIWDEPLNGIDAQSRVQIEKLLVKYSPAMLFVEHDETFVKNVATEIVLADSPKYAPA